MYVYVSPFLYFVRLLFLYLLASYFFPLHVFIVVCVTV